MIVTAAQAGLVGDGETDNTAAFQQFYSRNPAGFIELDLGAGVFLTNTVTVTSNRRIIGAGRTETIIRRGPAGGNYLLSCVAASALARSNIHNLTFTDVGFEGNGLGFAAHNHLLNLNGVTDLLIDACGFSGWNGDGLYLGSSNTAGVERHNRGVRVTDCVFVGSNDERNGVSVIDGDVVRIDGCTFDSVSRSGMPGAVDIEPNTGNTWAVVRDVVIEGCTFTDTGGYADVCVQPLVPQANLTTKAKRITVRNNTHNSPDARLLYFRSLADATVDTPTHDFVYSGNTQSAAIGGPDITLNGLAGGTFSGNSFASGFAYEVGNTEDCYALVGVT